MCFFTYNSHQNHFTCNPHPMSSSPSSSATYKFQLGSFRVQLHNFTFSAVILKRFVIYICIFGNWLLHLQPSLSGQLILLNSLMHSHTHLHISNMLLICKWKFSDTSCILTYLTRLSAPHFHLSQKSHRIYCFFLQKQILNYRSQLFLPHEKFCCYMSPLPLFWHL